MRCYLSFILAVLPPRPTQERHQQEDAYADGHVNGGVVVETGMSKHVAEVNGVWRHHETSTKSSQTVGLTTTSAVVGKKYLRIF